MATADKAFRDYGLVNEILDAIDIYEKVGPSEDNILKVIYVR
jgi:carbonic anhydrase